MELLGSLRRGEAGMSLDDVARNFGLRTDQVEAVVASIAPQLVQRIERNTLSRGGVADLVELLGSTSNNNQMVAAAALESNEGRAFGNNVLEQILGSKDASRAVAARASASTGIGETLIKSMLPYIASMVIGALTNKVSGGFGDILSKMPQLGGAGQARPDAGSASPFPAPSIAPSSAGSGSMLPGPDSMSWPGRGAGGPGRGAAGPGRGAGGSNPYGDLSDVIRRGGSNVGGSPLWNVVRGILGSVLGFQNKGFMGWLIRLIVMRYGWTIVRTIFGRVLFGR